MNNSSQQLINGRYRVVSNIGSDKSGYFVTLQDTADRKKYYTKLIRIDDNHLSAQGLYTLQMRTQRLTQFSHTNVISVYEPELSPEGLLLRQTDLPGCSLKSLMQKQGRPLPRTLSYQIALDIASALAALHSEGLVHGELDTSHIWIDDQGKNYLSFLELPPAFDIDSSVYHFPELTPSAEPRTDSDIFAFGILLLEMFTGLSAYRSAGGATDVEEYSRVFTYYKECLTESVGLEAPNLVPLLSRCLTDNKADRFKNGEELYWAVRELLEKDLARQEAKLETLPKPKESEKGGKPRGKKEKKTGFETGKKKDSRLGIIPVLLFGVLLIGASVWFWLRRPDTPQAAPTEEVTPAYEQTLSVLYITQTAMQENADRRAAEPTATMTPEPTATSTPVPTNTPQPRPISVQPGRSIRWNADDSVMAAIPASEFTMGIDNAFLFDMTGILPEHRVSLDAYWIDLTEVTQAQYARCVSEGVCQPIERIADEWIGDEYPIMNVRWTDANTYCSWAGKRLPSEAEWEKAARGGDARLYPWGNDSLDYGFYPNRIQKTGNDPQDVSPYGVRDMAGNVSEWVNDFYSETRLITDSVLVNPIGPISGNTHTIKGGSFMAEDPEFSRFVFSRSGSAPDSAQNLGFRCAVNAGQVDTLKASELSEPLTLAPAVKAMERPADCTDRAKFVDDVNIPDGTAVKKGEWITKTWLLENYGTCPWDENYKVVWSDETYENDQKLFDIGVSLMPGEQGEISVSFPVKGDGMTHISFLLANSKGETFGLGERGRGDLYIEYRAE